MMPTAYSQKMKMKVDSEHYFNHPDQVKEMKEYSDVYPVDVFGGHISEDKSPDNLKATEACIQERFGLKAGGEA